MTDPRLLPAREAARQIAERRLTAEALMASCLARIEAREDVVGAWQYLDRDRALAASYLERIAAREEVVGAWQ